MIDASSMQGLAIHIEPLGSGIRHVALLDLWSGLMTYTTNFVDSAANRPLQTSNSQVILHGDYMPGVACLIPGVKGSM